MTSKPGYHSDTQADARHDLYDGKLPQQGPYQGGAMSPPPRYSDGLRLHPYHPASTSRSSFLQHSSQAYPPGYVSQDREHEEALYSGRELSRNAVRPLVTCDQPFERQTYQPSFSDQYRSSFSNALQGSGRPAPGFGYNEPVPKPQLHRRSSSDQSYGPPGRRSRVSPTRSLWGTEYSQDYPDNIFDQSFAATYRSDTHSGEPSHSHQGSQHGSSQQKPHHTQKRANKDEFDGPTQYLPRPPTSTFTALEADLPTVPITLDVREQDAVLGEVNTRLSQCAFNFIAKYSFPIPLEAGKRRVESATDREWTEWAHLLKRLATKRRIPARLLYDGQIKQMVTVLENSLEMRHASAHLSRPPKDDWNVLQLVSAGVQVAKLLKDGETMRVLENLYRETEAVMAERKGRGGLARGPWGRGD